MARQHLLRCLLIAACLPVLCLAPPAVLGLDQAKEIERAQQLSAGGGSQQAIKILSGILARSPGNIPARVERGNILFNTLNWRLALQDELRLIQLIPHYQHGYVLLGICYDQLHNYGQAMAMHDKAIACGGPETGTAHRSKGMVFLELGKVGEARAEVLKGMAANAAMPEQKPHDLAAMAAVDRLRLSLPTIRPGKALSPQIVQAENLHLQGQDAESLSLLSALLKREPDNAAAHAIEGNIYADGLEYEKAIGEMKKAVEAESGFQHGYLVMGECQFHLEHFIQAQELLDRAIKCGGPETGTAHRDKSSVLLKLGRLKEARAELDQALKIHVSADPNSLREDLENRQQIDRAMNDMHAVVQDLTKKMAIPGAKSCDDRRNRANAYLQLDNLDLATKDFYEALNQCPADRDSLAGLLTIYTRQGNKKEAEKLKMRLEALDKSSY